jgi:diadenosine tetraphosphate (Ap4A) HIT family hydrolase
MQAAAGASVVSRGRDTGFGALCQSSMIGLTTQSVCQPVWSLHPRLAADTVPVGDLAVSRLLVLADANYPWVLLVPRRAGATEILDLEEAERAQLMVEIAQTSRALKAITSCDKLNVAAIGNVVPQLHIHIVARRTDDAAWPRPVWGAVPTKPYVPEALAALIAALHRALQGAWVSR